MDLAQLGFTPATNAAPESPPAPKSVLEGMGFTPAPVYQPKAAEGLSESVQAGLQGSVFGLAWRGKLPDLVTNPETASWWERAATGISQVVADLIPMAAGAAVGAPLGAAAGGAVTGPAAPVGAAVGGVLGAGAGMFGVPAAIRESLIQAYSSGEINTAAEFFNIVRDVAKVTAKESSIGAATFGVGGVAARVVGKAIAPSIGTALSVPTATKIIGASDVAAQIAAMTTMPAALEGRLPDAREIMDAAIVIGGVKAAHVTASRVSDIFVKTGKTPAEQVADVESGAVTPDEFVGPPRPEGNVIETRVATERAATRLAELNAKAEPKDGSQPEPLTAKEMRERTFLLNNEAKPEELAKRYAPVVETVEPAKVVEELAPARARLAELDRKVEAQVPKVADVADVAAEVPVAEVPPPKYTPEIQTKLDAAKEHHDQMVEFYKRNHNDDPVQLAASLKGEGFKYAAEKRQITGELTAREQAAKDKREAGNYLGKEVTVDGYPAKVTANPFGRVTVEYADGRKETVDADRVKAKETAPAADAKPAETIAEQAPKVEPLTEAEHLERDALREKIAALEAQLAKAERHEQGAQAVYDDVLRMMTEVDQQRTAAGLESFGEQYIKDVAALQMADAKSWAARMGLTPDEAYQRMVKARMEAAGVAPEGSMAQGGKATDGDAAYRNLIIQHNVTAANLLHADRMGGLAVPSLAITKSHDSMTNFGEITLIGDKAMADPKGYANTRVYGADVYSPRYPTISYKLDSKSLKKLNDELAPYREDGEREIYSGEIYKADDLFGNKAFEKFAREKYGEDSGYVDRNAAGTELLQSIDAGERIFMGFTYGGNKRYKAHTLDNVINILKKDIRGGEGFNYGVGSLRAKFTPQFRSVEQIKREEGRLVTKQEFEKIKKDVDENLMVIWNDLAPYSNRGKEFGFGDTVIAVLEDSGKLGIDRALKEYGITDVPQETKVKMAEFLTRLKNLPSEYFEAKITRGVDLAEFKGAVVPEGTSQKVIDLLKSRGVEISTYKKDGDQSLPDSARKQAVKELSAKLGENVLFQDENKGSYTVPERLITFLKTAEKSTAIHELGHHWLETLKHFASAADAPAEVKADWETVRRELAIPESGDIARASHEQWARTVERYFHEGNAPTAELQGVFTRFKAWLSEVYKSITDHNVEISDDLRGVLDRLFAPEKQAAEAEQLGVPKAYTEIAKANQSQRLVPGEVDKQLAREPFAEELALGPGSGAGKDSRVNAALINGPMDLKLALQRVSELDQANIQRARGGTEGVKSWEDANAEADRVITDTFGGELKVGGMFDTKVPHDIQQRAAFKLMTAIANHSLRLRDVILEKGQNSTVQEQFDYLQSIVRMRMAHAEFLGLRAASARALNQLRDMTPDSGVVGKMVETLFQSGKTPAEEAADLKAKLDQIMLTHFSGKSALDVAALQKDIKSLKGQLGLAKAVTEATKWDMVIEGWKSALLSGPVTHTTNLFGTAAFQVMRAPVDMLSAMIGMTRGAKVGTGDADRAALTEGVTRMTGMIGGIMDGLKIGYHTFKMDEVTGKTEAYKTAIPDKVGGNYIRIPLRLMAAEDAIISTMYKRGELKTLAVRDGLERGYGIASREMAEHVDRFMDNPPADALAAAEATSTRMTFNAELGEGGAKLQRFIHHWPVLQFIVPFIRTPVNVLKEVGRMSPFAPLVGEWRAAFEKGGIERDRAIAEFALGSGVMAVTMAMALSGQISGAGSPDQGKKAAKAGVWQPYSVQIGDTWYEYSRIQPTGTLMGVAADLAEVWDHMTPEEMDKVPKMLSVAFANAVTNQTFLQGITNVINAMSDPNRYGSPFVRQFAASWVPNIIAQPTAMADPVVREVNSVIDAVKARVPGLRQELLVKQDWLGEDTPTKERVAVVAPVRVQPISEDKVRQEADRLDLSVSMAPKKGHIGKGTGKLGEFEYTPEERNKFAKVGGQFAHGVLSGIVSAPGYDQIPDMIKRRIFSKVLAGSHKVAAVAALPLEKRVAYIQSINEKMADELAPAE